MIGTLTLRLIAAVFVSVALCAPTYAQWQTQNHSVPIGRGAAVTGFGKAVPGVAGQVFTSNGASADPSFQPNGGSSLVVPSIAALKALDTTVTVNAYLTAAGRSGNFILTSGDYTVAVAADVNNGVYVKPDGLSASVAVWVRQFDFVNYDARWFGPVADYATDNSAVINTIIAVTDVPNTLPATGRQGAAEINIPGSVRFSTTSLSFLPLAGHVFVNINYFANSNLTKGYPVGSGGTNESYVLSVNSGYPADPTGAYVAERRFTAPVHPALVIEQDSTLTGTDAHFQCSVPLVLGQCSVPGQQSRVPTDNNPVNTSLVFEKDNADRALITVSNYGVKSSFTAMTLSTSSHSVSLAGQAGFSSTAWCGNTCVPVTGDTIQGATSGALGYLKSAPAGDVLQLQWLSGVFQPGEAVISNGHSTAPTAIAGGGVGFGGSVPNNALWFGLNVPQLTLGIPPGNALTAMTIGGRLAVTTTAGVFGAKAEVVTNPSVLWQSGGSTGRQVVLDSSNRLCTVNGVVNGTGSNCNGLVGAAGAHGTFNGATAALAANSFNISSVTYLGSAAAGYRVNLTNSLLNSNYAVSFGMDTKGNFPTVISKTTSNFVVANFDGAGAAINVIGNMDVTVAGGQ